VAGDLNRAGRLVETVQKVLRARAEQVLDLHDLDHQEVLAQLLSVVG
jgi:hypothetical protein